MTIITPVNDDLNNKVKKAIEDILVEIVPAEEEGGDERPSTDEEFESEQKRYITD